MSHHRRSPKGMRSGLLAVVTAVTLLLSGLVGIAPAARLVSAPSEPRTALHGMGASAAAAPEYAPDRVLVAFRRGAGEKGVAAAHARAGVGAAFETVSPSRRLVLVRLKKGVDVVQAEAAYRTSAEVAYVQPDFIYHSAVTTPNDPRFGDLWGLHNTGQTGGVPGDDIHALEAWASQTGTRAVVVADIDTGLDYNHPDLANNVWTNPGEIPGNGIDDDGNGFVDDVHGYDFVNNDGDPMDDNKHGTHTAGTIGAEGQNATGVVGVCWHVSIMPLKFLDASGSGDTANAVRAIDYAKRMGADVANNSWGGGGYDQALYDAIKDFGKLFVVAAGNTSGNDDIVPTYPAAYDLPNIIAVAATDAGDNVAPFSCYGKDTVDVAAPGVGIWSTVPGGSYENWSGTSMAAPHVSGIAALLLSQDRSLTAVELKQAIESTVDRRSGLSLLCTSGGRVNAAAALSVISATTWPATASLTPSALTTSGLDLRWSPFWGAQGYQVIDGGSVAASLDGATTSLHLRGLVPGSTHALKVEALQRTGAWTTDGPSTSVTMLSSALMAIDHGQAFTSATVVSLDSTVDGASQMRFPAGTRWISLATGAYHSLAVNADGALFAWGLNNNGQVGDGTTADRPSPARLGAASDWTTVAAGEVHSVAIERDGSLWTWGKNSYGALGDGTTITRTSPVRVGSDTDWVAAAAGWQFTIAMKRDGSLWGWGYNGLGQLGDGTYTSRYTPTRIGTATDWASFVCGDSHVVAVKRDGGLWAWGYNGYGQLGDGTIGNRPSPTRIGTATDWSAVSAGYYHSLAVKRDGSLWAWGYNGFLQLGDGTTLDHHSPYRIGTAYDWARPAGGGFQSLATKRDGSLWAWGFNNNGQLADGTTAYRWVPARSGTDTGWATVVSCDAHAAGIKTDGTLSCWGYNAYGQLGDSTSADRWVPTPTSQPWQSWQAYAASVPATLTPGDGPKSLSAQYLTSLGDSLTLSGGIVLDTAPPTTVVGGVPAGGVATTSVTLSLVSTDALSGVARIEYLLDSVTTTCTFTAPLPVRTPGPHSVAYWATDGAGNREASRVATFTILSGTVTGTVTNGGIPLPRIVVSAFDASSDAFVRGVFTDALGDYSLALPGGAYHLRSTGTTPSSLAQFYDHALSIDIARSVSVTVGAEVSVSSDLAWPVQVTQAIAGTITAGGSPCGGIVVTAFDATANSYVKGVFTDPLGHYVLTLPPGSYHLRFTNTTPSSLSQYYDHTATIDSADAVTVASGVNTTVSSDLAWPVQVTQAIAGTITAGGSPCGGIVVTAFDATANSYVKGVFTDPLGHYVLTLPPGSYHLRFTNTTPSSLSQYYDHTATIDSADAVTVASGVNTTVSSDLAP